MADFTEAAWPAYVSSLSDAERRQAMRDLSSRIHRVLGPTGQPIDLAPGPKTAEVAPLVEITRDEFGRSKMKHVEPAKSETLVPGDAPHLTPDDLTSFRAFEKSISKLPPEQRNSSMEKLFEVFAPRLIHD